MYVAFAVHWYQWLSIHHSHVRTSVWCSIRTKLLVMLWTANGSANTVGLFYSKLFSNGQYEVTWWSAYLIIFSSFVDLLSKWTMYCKLNAMWIWRGCDEASEGHVDQCVKTFETRECCFLLYRLSSFWNCTTKMKMHYYIHINILCQ